MIPAFGIVQAADHVDAVRGDHEVPVVEVVLVGREDVIAAPGCCRGFGLSCAATVHPVTPPTADATARAADTTLFRMLVLPAEWSCADRRSLRRGRLIARSRKFYQPRKPRLMRSAANRL